MKVPRAKLTVIVVAFGLLAASAATAETVFPFCRSGGGDVGSGVGACKYASFEQCRVSSAGFGTCSANPAYVPSTAPPAAERRARRR